MLGLQQETRQIALVLATKWACNNYDLVVDADTLTGVDELIQIAAKLEKYISEGVEEETNG